MSVRIKATTFLPEMFANFVGFASPSNPDVLIVETKDGKFTIHDDDVKEYFYN